MDMKVAIGERIAKLRKAKNLSQQQFSYDAEIERSYLTHVEKGRKNIYYEPPETGKNRIFLFVE
jgi:transcriptional regulator with XRE-family HTH domain